MPDREKVVYGLKCITGKLFPVPAVTCPTCHYTGSGEDFDDCVMAIAEDALELLEEQEEIKEQFIEAFNTIRDAYNAPANREKILLNYLLRNACCCEQKTAD